MSDLVPTEEIEPIVGAARHAMLHLGRAVSAERKVYILHSSQCLDSPGDLRDCPFSLALDNGIRVSEWDGFEDAPVVISIDDDDSYHGQRLVPTSVVKP